MNPQFLSQEEEEKLRGHYGIPSNEFSDVCSYCGKRKHIFTKAPKEIKIEIWSWITTCYSCKRDTPVIWPHSYNGVIFWSSLFPDSFENLPEILSEKYPFFQIIKRKNSSFEMYGNTCIHCSAYQGEYYVLDEYSDISGAKLPVKKEMVTVPLTKDEQILFAKCEETPNFHSPRKGAYSTLCSECYALYKKKKI